MSEFLAPPQTSTLSLPQATLLLGKLNLKILWRGNLWWITALCSMLPVVVARTVGARHATDAALEAGLTLLSIFAPLLVAGSVGEDVEKKTYAYLWSRPIPRSAFIFGKLLAYVPFLTVLFAATALLGATMAAARGGDAVALGKVALGVGAGALLFSAASALLATITPKHATGFALFYMLFVDNVLGSIPTSIRYLSIQYQARAVMDVPDHGLIPVGTSLSTGLLAGACFLAVCLAVTLRRSQRLE